MTQEDLETLLKIAKEKPYHGQDHPIKRRKLAKRLKGILATHLGENSNLVIRLFSSRRGFTPSDQLLKYSFRAFEKCS
jgi:hypothetical protein